MTSRRTTRNVTRTFYNLLVIFAALALFLTPLWFIGLILLPFLRTR